MWNILRILVFLGKTYLIVCGLITLTHLITFCVLESLWHCYINFILEWAKYLQLMEICIFIKIIIQIMSV